METTLEITVFNWKKYNPESIRTRSPHWFRFNRDACLSGGLTGLTAEQCWVWVQILAECCRKNSDTVAIKLSRLSRICLVSKEVCLDAVNILSQNDTLKVAAALTTQKLHRNYTETTHTEHNNTLQNIHNNTEHSSRGGKKPSVLLPGQKSLSVGSSKLIAAYITAYQARYKARPVIDGRTQGLVKRVLEAVPLETACDLIQAYLQMRDKWFITKAHDFCTFYENLTKISASLQTGSEVGSAPKEKTWQEIADEQEGKKNGKNELRTGIEKTSKSVAE